MRRIDRKKEYVEIPPLVDVSVQDPSRKRGKNSGRTNTETRSTFEYKGQQKTNPLYLTLHDCKKKNERERERESLTS